MEDRQTGYRAWPKLSTTRELLSESKPIADTSALQATNATASGPILVPMNHIVADSLDPERQLRLEKIEHALKLLDIQNQNPKLEKSLEATQNYPPASKSSTIVIELKWEYLAQVFAALLFVYMAYQFHSMQERIVFLEASLKAMA